MKRFLLLLIFLQLPFFAFAEILNEDCVHFKNDETICGRVAAQDTAGSKILLAYEEKQEWISISDIKKIDFAPRKEYRAPSAPVPSKES